MAPGGMAERLSGKTVLITGASSGIGRSTAFEFARTSPKDLRIIITARRVERLNRVAKEIESEVGTGVKICVRQLDVANLNEISNLVTSLPEDFQKIDILVNNAGFMRGNEQPPDIPQKEIQEVWATNVTGVVNMTQAVLSGMKERDKGDIIMLGSIAGRDPYPGGTLYCASKAAVAAFTSALRKELIGTKIRIMTIDPGRVETEFSVIRYRNDQAAADALYAGTEPLTPDDIAEVIVFSAGRRENVVVAEALLFPSHQASATHVHRNPV